MKATWNYNQSTRKSVYLWRQSTKQWLLVSLDLYLHLFRLLSEPSNVCVLCQSGQCWQSGTIPSDGGPSDICRSHHRYLALYKQGNTDTDNMIEYMQSHIKSPMIIWIPAYHWHALNCRMIYYKCLLDIYSRILTSWIKAISVHGYKSVQQSRIR